MYVCVYEDAAPFSGLDIKLFWVPNIYSIPMSREHMIIETTISELKGKNYLFLFTL